MNEANDNKQNIKQIDFVKIFRVIRKSIKTYLIVLPITFVVACLIILCVPRYYRCQVSLAPELSNSSSLGGMSSIASSFGIDLSGSLSGTDAIYPTLYPELMSSTNFLVSMFPTKIVTSDGEKYTYYEYLSKHQKNAWWDVVKGKVMSLFEEKDTSDLHNKGEINPFRLTKKQERVALLISSKISCGVDKKTDVISILVEDQDPLVCATIADSVRVKLQDFITEYRTNKARNDLRQMQTLYNEAKEDYEEARKAYSAFVDRNQDLVLQSYHSKQEDLENEMQIRYNIYSSLASQLQVARAKVQERTPAFTTLQCATVPTLPAGPRRTMFVAVVTFLAFCVTTLYKYIKEP